MGFIMNFIFWLVVILGIIIFLKLDSRMSIVNRLLISILAVLVLFLLFLFISALISIVIVVVVIILLVGFLERKKVRFRKYRRK